MEDAFKIYVLRLREGEQEKIEESLDPAFLEIEEEELFFETPVVVRGTAEISGEFLLVRFSAATEAKMPCSICNQEAVVSLRVKDFTQLVSLEEIRSGVYAIKDVLREAILLELPSTIECHEGSCPERENLAQYFMNSEETNK
ncbi:MAG: hypothetical protein K940chlam9_00600 [Chlamydiae bacterium]|nr:hypothetical protein [Chlamydiota bacterium]